MSLTITQSRSVLAAAAYFREGLKEGDYYLGQSVGATWRGRCAEALGIQNGSPVTDEQFAAMLAGQHPLTLKSLTQRRRTGRRPGCDLTWSVPKSVSIVWRSPATIGSSRRCSKPFTRR